MSTIHVPLHERSYDVQVEKGSLDHAGEIILKILGKTAAAVITDDNVAPLYLERTLESLNKAGIKTSAMILPHGEKTKSLDNLTKLYTFLVESNLTRKDTVVSLGGGVIGDLSGMAAATYMRGINFVQIPTSLLAQVDSSVGGKVAVDLPQGKNLVGAFHQPKSVICDPETLVTLPEKFWRDGMGEVVKYCCIGDEFMFNMIMEKCSCKRDLLMKEIETIIDRCVQMKADYVTEDELDTGSRIMLNFGHTIGHAIEATQSYAGLSHGEAVAVGMSQITRMTEKIGITSAGTTANINAILQKIGLPHELPCLLKSDLIKAMNHDKKLDKGNLNIVVLEKIGKCKSISVPVEFFSDNL